LFAFKHSRKDLSDIAVNIRRREGNFCETVRNCCSSRSFPMFAVLLTTY